jgi:hypothetical protein
MKHKPLTPAVYIALTFAVIGVAVSIGLILILTGAFIANTIYPYIFN